MRYSQIRSMDVSNGIGIGVALFVQGCPIHCFNCFNSETWDFNSGSLWTTSIEEQFINLANKPYIQRISILGGEPLAEKHSEDIYELVTLLRTKFNNEKQIWLYTGYTWETLKSYQKKIVEKCHILIDGPYKDNLKNSELLYRGSSNQRIIDIQKSIESNSIVLWKK